MSTVATTRGPSIVLTQIAAETSTLRPLAAMHPDCLLLPLQQQNASSPRLGTLTPPSIMNEEYTEIDMPLRIDEDPDDIMDATTTSSTQHDIDAVSVCSDTSVLSVGQEHHAAMAATAKAEIQLRRHSSAFSSVQTIASADCSDARSSISTDEPATTPHCLDDDLQQQQQHQQQHQLHQPTGLQTPTQQHHVVMDPFIVANALRIPVPLVPRPNNSPFQEEFLRKSQLYAGEIMKQQMQLMAAARANAFALRPNDHQRNSTTNSPHFAQLTAISKITQLNAVAAAAAAAAAVVANNQKFTTPAAVHSNNDTLAQLSALSMAQQQTQALKTVSNFNRLQAQMNLPHHNHYHNHINYNNNTNTNTNNNTNNNHFHHDPHEPALKFSIDNILKEDFGRRMAAAAAAADQTLLLKQRRKNSATYLPASTITTTTAAAAAAAATTTTTKTATTIPNNAVMDLSSLMSSAVSVASSNFSNSLANICTNSNDSSSTALSGSINYNNNNNNHNDFLKSPNSSISGDHTPTTGAHNRLTNVINEKSDASSDQCKNISTSSVSTQSSSSTTTTATTTSTGTGASGSGPIVWPAWVYCTRYSDRPSSGPRARKPKKATNEKGNVSPSSGSSSAEDKRPRTAFSGSQLARLKHEFTENRYLTEKRRQQLSSELGLNEAQIKIWFQNKRAKLKKSSGTKNPLALQLMAQGLYNHSTVPLTREEEELQEMQERERESAAAAAAAATTAAATVT